MVAGQKIHIGKRRPRLTVDIRLTDATWRVEQSQLSIVDSDCVAAGLSLADAPLSDVDQALRRPSLPRGLAGTDLDDDRLGVHHRQRGFMTSSGLITSGRGHAGTHGCCNQTCSQDNTQPARLI